MAGNLNFSLLEGENMTDDSETCFDLWLDVNATSNRSSDIHMLNFSEKSNLKFSIPVYGYITPLLLLVTFFTNSVVVAVLSRPHMKSPSNFILCAMAITDLCTLGIPVPMFIYQYTLGFHRNPVSCYLAVLDLLMTDVLPTVCHSASIWLTLMLAVQRYIYVCHPGKARIWCTIPRVTYGTLVIYAVAIIYNLPRLFALSFSSIEFPWQCSLVSQCLIRTQEWAVGYYFPLYYWFRVCCANVLPCLLLVVLNALLVKSLEAAQANRKRLFRERKQESSKQRDSNCTTMMLVAVVFVFLAVELPLACIMFIFIAQNTWDLKIIDRRDIDILIVFSNLCIGLSYSIYFPIYCSMSRQFRETFKELFIRAKKFTQETAARNGVVRRTTLRRTDGSNGAAATGNNGCETVFISTADNEDVSFNQTVMAHVSGTGGNTDEIAVKLENETLL